MPERWQTELRRLKRLEAPPDLDDRISAGPRLEPPRPRRERIAAGVVAFAVCAALAAGGFVALENDRSDGANGIGGGRPPVAGVLVLTLTAAQNGPEATVRFGEEQQDVTVEGYEWCASADGTCSSMTADFASWPPSNGYLVVPGETPISVEGDGSARSVEILDASGEPIVGLDGSATPADDGRYVFHVNARYPQGSASLYFGIQTLNDASAAPDVLGVDCSLGVAELDTSVVRARSDGLHVRFTGADATSTFEIVDPSKPGDLFAVGRDEGERAFGLRPGNWALGCGQHVGASDTVPFVLIDPDDRYAPSELACDAAPESTFVSAIPSTTPHAEAASVLVTGLEPGDQVRGAGYGAETWRLGPTYVVDRGGEAVARMVLGDTGGMWAGTFATCDASGVALSAIAMEAAPTRGGALPDELVVRCEGDGPALTASAVRLQPDGLHIEGTNVGDAVGVSIKLDEAGTPPLAQLTFEHASETWIVDLAPGAYWIGCPVAAMTGPTGANSATTQSFARIEVLSPR